MGVPARVSWVLTLLMVAVTACGAERDELIVRGGEDCRYDGPTQLDIGYHDVILFPQGSGEFRVKIHRLQAGATFEEVANHYQSESARFDPPNTQQVLNLSGGRSVRGTTRTHQFASGDYVVVCNWTTLNGETAVTPVGSFTVTDDQAP